MVKRFVFAFKKSKSQLSIELLAFLMLSVVSAAPAFAGTRFRLARREVPPCHYDPKAVGNLAVINSDQSEATAEAVARIQAALSKDGFFAMVSREDVRTILSEQALSLSGFVNQKTVQRAGQLLGADSLLLVKAVRYRASYKRGKSRTKVSVYLGKSYWKGFNRKTKQAFTPKGQSIKVSVTYVWEEKNARVQINAHLIQTETGRELCNMVKSRHIKVLGVAATKDIKVPLRLVKKEKIYTLSEKGEKEAIKYALKHYRGSIGKGARVVDFNKIPDDAQLEPELWAGATLEVAREIIPPMVVREREIGKGKTELSKRALEKALAGEWKDAGKLWAMAVKVAPNDHDAWGGLGIYFEYKQMKAKAKEVYTKAREIAPHNRGFPHWLDEVEKMLNDYSSSFTDFSETKAPYAEAAYVGAKKSRQEILIVPHKEQSQVGSFIGLFSPKMILDKKTGGILLVEKVWKGLAVIEQVTERAWQARVLKQWQNIQIDDKVEVVHPGLSRRNGYFAVLDENRQTEEVILKKQAGTPQLEKGDQLRVVRSSFEVKRGKGKLSLQFRDQLIGEVKIVQTEGEYIKAQWVKKPKRKLNTESRAFFAVR